MKVLKALAALLVAVLVLFFGGALLIDPAYEVTRSVHVNAAPARLTPLVDSSQGWARWGVWYRRDPAMKITETGAARGTGAAWAWQSASQGNGAMTLTDVQPDLRMAYELRIEGFDPSRGDLSLVAEDAGTRVTWRMQGRMSSLANRWFGLFMDRLVGPDFDEGLANLKALAEQPT